jgi:hypothetical protein
MRVRDLVKHSVAATVVECGSRCGAMDVTDCACRYCEGMVCRLVSTCADGCRYGPDSAVQCHGGAFLPPGARNKSRIVRLGTGSVRSCRTVPGHAAGCRRVPPDGGICRPVTIRHD